MKKNIQECVRERVESEKQDKRPGLQERIRQYENERLSLFETSVDEDTNCEWKVEEVVRELEKGKEE